LPYLAIYII